MEVKKPKLKLEKDLGVKKATLKTDKLLHDTVNTTIKGKNKKFGSKAKVEKNLKKYYNL